MPKVSIIIPIYNVEKYIERCARSLFEQTLDDLEFIFVNDCTQDKSIEVLLKTLNEYPSRKAQVRLIQMPVNSGQAKVRKIGIQAATGDYIIHCDSDDWVDRTIYEKMWSKAENEKLDMVICGIGFSDGTQTFDTDYNSWDGYKSLKHAILADAVRNFLWNKLIRKDLYNHISEWPVCNFWEDVCIICQIAFHCKSIEKIDKPLYFYCWNENGTTSSINEKKKTLDMRENISIAIKHIRLCGGWKEFRKDFIHRKCVTKTWAFNATWIEYVTRFPEINLNFLFDSRIEMKKKYKHLCKCLGIYDIYLKFRK